MKLPAHSASNDDEAFALFDLLAFLLGAGDTIQPFEFFFLGESATQKLTRLGRLVAASGSTIADVLAVTADNDARRDARIGESSGRVAGVAKACLFPFRSRPSFKGDG